ncbi:hypothetical protein [Haladaptatus halobius]|uniref:hypothetical protein n=1 Tax=Haladaptatus halobius TaxID=2884875 RepID=UPI001D09CF24|nr:hypothetical protein [Haladaptatus halobius]
MVQNVSVQGLEKQDDREVETSDNSPRYEEHLVVEIGDRLEKIPVTDVHLSSFGYNSQQKDEPDPISFNRVFLDGNTLHAERWLNEDTVLELLRPSSGGPWEIHRIEHAPKERTFTTIWERDTPQDSN